MKNSMPSIISIDQITRNELYNENHADDIRLSVYRGIIVLWDENFDPRVLEFIDALPSEVMTQLVVISEHEGCVTFVWEEEIPDGYEEGEMLEAPEDLWTVFSSVVNPCDDVPGQITNMSHVLNPQPDPYALPWSMES